MGTHSGIHLADGVLQHLHILHIKALLQLLGREAGEGSGSGVWGRGRQGSQITSSLLGPKEPHLWQRLVDLHRVQATRAQPLLALLLLILLHGLLYTQLGAAPNTLLKGLQFILEALHVLVVCGLWNQRVGAVHWTPTPGCLGDEAPVCSSWKLSGAP